MKILAVIAAAAAVFGASAASAASPLDGVYVQANGGVATNDPHSLGSYGLSVGKVYGPVRLEAEYQHLGSIGSQNVHVDMGNANLYFSPVNLYGVKPFVEAGVGYGTSGGWRNLTHTGSVIYNAGVGADYDLTNRLALTGQYRHYVSNDTQVVTHAGTANLRDDTLTVGLRYKF